MSRQLIRLVLGFATFATVAQQADGRTIEFSGMTWEVKSGCGLGPGPSCWSEDTESVWVDGLGRLHMKVRESDGVWYSAEVSTQESFGYGDYRFQIETNTELFDPNVVLGMFTYKDRGFEDPDEIDIELTRFGNAASSDTGHYTVQPYTTPGNGSDFALGLGGTFATHRFMWDPEAIFFQSIHGHHDQPPTPGHEISQWTYTGPDIPTASDEKLHINLWMFQGMAPADGLDVELIVKSVSVMQNPEPSSLAASFMMAVAGIGCWTRRRPV